jgi:hypothetical protein
MSIIQFTPDAPSASIDLCGTRVQYTRWNGNRNAILTGKVMAVHLFIPRNSDEPINEYFIIPDKECSNLSYHIIEESDMIGAVGTCPRCNGHQVLSITGDNDVPCPECGIVELQVIF